MHIILIMQSPTVERHNVVINHISQMFSIGSMSSTAITQITSARRMVYISPDYLASRLSWALCRLTICHRSPTNLFKPTFDQNSCLMGDPGRVTRNTINWLSLSIPASNGSPRDTPLVLKKSLSHCDIQFECVSSIGASLTAVKRK